MIILRKWSKEESVIPPLQIIQTLYAKGTLKSESQITQMKLGYSTLVKLTRTQVLVPTWEVQVKLADDTIEEYFVNAVEGKLSKLMGTIKRLKKTTTGELNNAI